MNRAPRADAARQTADIIDFDEALLGACAAERQAELMTEAAMLADAFAPDGRQAEIGRLAASLQSGVRDMDKGRAHARLLAAALRRLARENG